MNITYKDTKNFTEKQLQELFLSVECKNCGFEPSGGKTTMFITSLWTQTRL